MRSKYIKSCDTFPLGSGPKCPKFMNINDRHGQLQPLSSTKVSNNLTMLMRSWARDILFSVATMTARQRNGGSKTRKNTKNVKALRCLKGVPATNIDIMPNSTIYWPENRVPLSRQCCREPSSVLQNLQYLVLTALFLYTHAQILRLSCLHKAVSQLHWPGCI